jgi:hypothetical protein
LFWRRLTEKTLLTFDLSCRGPVVTNKFTDINMWSVDETWTRWASDWPRDTFQVNHPCLRRVQLMAATGGNVERDLFVHPEDTSTLTDYQFDTLFVACRNIVAHGLKPMIKVGQVPLKLSAQPHLGLFGTNVRPPQDYAAYYRYVRALVTALERHFGAPELATWTWGVGVECDNRDWFEADDGQAETTQAAYLRLYDTTVAALEDALGAANVRVGAHAMGITPGAWDPLEFLRHCARGGHVDYLALSYYTPMPGFDRTTFDALLERMQSGAERLGLKHLSFGIDEGRVLEGWDGKVLYPREVQHPIQAASDAHLFHRMVALGVDYCSTWCLTTMGVAAGIPLVSSHVRNLAWRMVGSALLAGTREAESPPGVDGLACYDVSKRMLRVMLYHCSSERDATRSASVKVRIAGHAASGPIAMRVWRLDRDHGNWWQAWTRDAAARHLGPDAFSESTWTPRLPHELVHPTDMAFWQSRQDHYAHLGELKSVMQRLQARPSQPLEWSVRLQPHAVVLYEIPVDAEEPGGGRTK